MPRKNNSVVVTFRFEGRRYSVSGKTKKEAYEKKALKLQALQDGSYVLESSMKVSDWIDVAFSTRHVKEITLQRDRQKCNKWIGQKIGHMPLKSVRTLHLQNIMDETSGLSESFITDIFRLIRWLFTLAYENKMINNNPSKLVNKPKGTINKRRSITQYERQHLLSVCDADEVLIYFLPMLFCGLRPSECQNLLESDIDRQNAILHVRGTKNASSDRYVPIPKYLLERLPNVADDDYVFKTVNGQRIDENGNRRLWDRLRRAMNLSMGAILYRNKVVPSGENTSLPFDEKVTPYHLRHTYCCDCCKSGIDVVTCMHLMGHSSLQMVASVYSHLDDEMIKSASELLEKRSEKVTKLYDNVVPLVVPNAQSVGNA